MSIYIHIYTNIHVYPLTLHTLEYTEHARTYKRENTCIHIDTNQKKNKQKHTRARRHRRQKYTHRRIQTQSNLLRSR